MSSSSIRAALAEGRVVEAAELLGYPWFAAGTRGARATSAGAISDFRPRISRSIRNCGLKHGIYAVRVGIGGVIRDGVASFGTRPTFDNGAPLLEVHLFDFSGDLYGAPMDVAFIGWIRPELKFDSVEALVRRMDDDARLARAALARAPGAFPPLGEISSSALAPDQRKQASATTAKPAATRERQRVGGAFGHERHHQRRRL